MSQSLLTDISWAFDPSTASSIQLPKVAEKMLEAYHRTGNKKDWLGEAKGLLEFANALEERNTLVRGLILYVVRAKWEEIRLEDKTPYYRFGEWAIRITGKDDRTLNNWMRTAEVFVVNPKGIEFPKKVRYEIKTPQVNGKEEREIIEEPFDPEKVRHTKLILAARQVADGEMTAEKWSALANPQVGYGEFMEVVYGHRPHDKVFKSAYEKSVVKMEGPVMYRDFGMGLTEEILEFNPTEFDNPKSRVKRDINSIMEFMSVK